MPRPKARGAALVTETGGQCNRERARKFKAGPFGRPACRPFDRLPKAGECLVGAHRAPHAWLAFVAKDQPRHVRGARLAEVPLEVRRIGTRPVAAPFALVLLEDDGDLLKPGVPAFRLPKTALGDHVDRQPV